MEEGLPEKLRRIGGVPGLIHGLHAVREAIQSFQQPQPVLTPQAQSPPVLQRLQAWRFAFQPPASLPQPVQAQQFPPQEAGLKVEEERTIDGWVVRRFYDRHSGRLVKEERFDSLAVKSQASQPQVQPQTQVPPSQTQAGFMPLPILSVLRHKLQIRESLAGLFQQPPQQQLPPPQPPSEKGESGKHY
jgi:hypothetical protein